MEALVDLNITYKLADGGKDAWKDVPILLSRSKQRYTEPMNSPVATNGDEILELKKEIQLLKHEKSILIGQTKELPPIKHEESNFQLEIKEKDRQIALLRNDFQLLQQKNDTFQHQIKTNSSKIVSLQKETQELKLKSNNLEQQVREKDNKITLVQTENQSLRYNTEEYEQQLKSKDTKINLLENEKRGYRRTSIQQIETLNSLQQEKQTMEQDKTNTTNEMERLKSINMTLEQLLKSKEDTIMSLNRENQGHQQGANEMVETLKSLLEAKTSETELLKQNMEHVLEKGKAKIKKLQKEIKRLERNQHTMGSRKARPSTVPESATSSNTAVPESAASNTGTNEDDPNNDINYDTESSTEHNSSNDSSSEDGNNINDFNYDSYD
jgi:chromosome segregation ATPase